MGTGYLLDSNVVIGFLAGKIPARGMAAVSGIIDDVPRISVITQIEVLRFNGSPETEKILHGFINISVVYPLDNAVIQRTIALCKQRKMKLPDAVIAATSLDKNCVLVTRNVDDFKNITGLELFNPWEMKNENENEE